MIGPLIPQQSQLMLDQRVIGDKNLRLSHRVLL